MLTEKEYQELWDKFFIKKIKEISMPSYCEYLKREIQFQDYLDLFIGNISHQRNENGIVNLYGCEINIGSHPFEKEIITQPKKIKYILVAEAPPVADTYFYNINHIKETAYFTAPCKAFGVEIQKPFTSESKRNALLELADKGVILLDLFPFAISFNSSLRKSLNKNATRSFWSDILNPNSILNRINHFTALKCVYTEFKIALIAPPIISHFIADSNLPIPNGCVMDKFKNSFLPIEMPFISRKYYFKWPDVTLLNGLYSRNNLKSTPIFKCCAYGGSGIVPHELFILNAIL